MQATKQTKCKGAQPAFTRGMTLDKYMAQARSKGDEKIEETEW